MEKNDIFKWEERFLALAEETAGWSKDESTKVGAVLVDSDKIVRCVGYNGIPRKVRDDIQRRYTRPEKYMWFNHAEMNLLSNCARIGVRTEGCTLYVTHHPCAACARSIIQSGIERVVYRKHENDFSERWKEDMLVAGILFVEAGVELIGVD